MMKRLALLLVIAGFASATFADGLSKQFKNWDRTPEAYFLTSSERAQWKKVRTDQEAQSFISDYKSRRGSEWETMVKERVVAADKYFSSGETKGSETFRGKVIIMFGPPSDIDQGNARSNSRKADPTTQDLGIGGGSGSIAMSSGGASPLGTAPRHADSPTMTLVYDKEHAPKAIGKPFRAEVKMISSTYQEAANPDELNPKFEAVAEDSIVKPGAEAKPAEPPPPH